MREAATLRSSDIEREQVVALLRAALADGRLQIDEGAERIGLAYQAQTRGDLAVLHADLPTTTATNPRPPVIRGARGRLPTILRLLWTTWLTAVSVNVVTWALVSITSGRFIYLWPIWVAGPFGAALTAISICTRQIQARRDPRSVRRLPA